MKSRCVAQDDSENRVHMMHHIFWGLTVVSIDGIFFNCNRILDGFVGLKYLTLCLFPCAYVASEAANEEVTAML